MLVCPTNRRPSLRRGFTIIELMGVIAIIAFAMGAFVLVLGNYISLARGRGTQVTIRKLDDALSQRLDGWRQRDFSDAAMALVNNGTVPNVEVGKILARKQQYRIAFPQNTYSSEAAIPVDNRSGPYALIRTWIENAPAGPERDLRLRCESSACLFLILSEGASYGAPTLDDGVFAGSSVREEEVATGSGTYIRYFVDAWGEPLRFYRAPTRLFWLGEDLNRDGVVDLTWEDFDNNAELTEPTAVELSNNEFARRILVPGLNFTSIGSRVHPFQVDPDDPHNRLAAYWKILNNSTTTNRFAEFYFHTPSTFWVPLIVSAGPDRMLGLAEPMSTDGNSDEAAAKRRLVVTDLSAIVDNITNLNLNVERGN